MSIMLKSSIRSGSKTLMIKQAQIDSLKKELENLENRIKIEQRNRVYRRDTHFIEKTKLEKLMDISKEELEITLNTLNEKEKLVYDVQKGKFTNFSSEIQSFESVANELEKRLNSTKNILNTKQKQYNYDSRTIGMEEADYESYQCELNFQDQEKNKLLGRIGAIERTYPKEFEYLYQDLVLKKELQEVINKRSVIKRKLIFMYEDKVKQENDLNSLRLELSNKKEEIESNDQKLDEAIHDIYFSTMESYLEQQVSDLFSFDKFKLLTQKFYQPKKFNLEVELNKSLIANLSKKQSQMRKEAGELRKNLIEKRVDFVRTLQDLYDASQVYCKDRTKLKEEMFRNEDEIKMITYELQLIEKNFRKKDGLFTKYIQSLQENVNEATKENSSYWDLNPALITEKEFESKLEEELIKVVKQKYFGEELFEKENIIKQYFKETEKRESNIQNLKFTELKLKKEYSEIEYKINQRESENTKQTHEILLMESQLNDILFHREIIINQRVESRNSGLSKHLLAYSADDFEKYLTVNKNLYKQVLRKFSYFNFRTLSLSDREIFFELVIDDHSMKKNKYFDLIGQLIHDQAIMDNWEITKDSLYKKYCKNYENFVDLAKDIDQLSKEIELLSSSELSLRDKIEYTLKKQIYELQLEKKDLQVKYNVNYYKFRAKELSNKIDELQLRMDKFQTEYDASEENYKEEMIKLLEEDKRIKDGLIEFDIYSNAKKETEEESKYGFESNDYIKNKKFDLESKTFNEEIRKTSLTDRSKSIDFGKTLQEVNFHLQNTNFLTGLEDIKVFDSRIPEEVIEEEIKSQDDLFFINSSQKVSLLIFLLYRLINLSKE